MKNKSIVFIATLFALIDIVLIKLLFFSKTVEKPAIGIASSFEILDEEDKIKMVFPDSIIKSSNRILIAGIACAEKNYLCNPNSNAKIELMVLKMPIGINDTSVKNVLHNYFYNIASGQDFKAGKLKGVTYKSYICGVPVVNFLGISGNKIYHYSETINGDTLNYKSNLKNLMIDLTGENIRTFLTSIKEPRDSPAIKVNSSRAKVGAKNLESRDVEPEDMNTIRVDMSFKAFQANPDTLICFVKQHYYAIEHTFQKSISCNFENGTSKETIAYPSITYTIKLYEKSTDFKPYQIISKSYLGNSTKK